MVDVLLSEAEPSSSFTETRLICRVCQKQFSQYTCPRCNTRYCSLECYKRHSLCCTESFMRENVVEELHQIQSNDETKRKMLEMLRRVHSEEDMDSDGKEDSMLSEDTVKFFLSGFCNSCLSKHKSNLSWYMRKIFKRYKCWLKGDELKIEDLSPTEIKKFQRAIASGELSKLIEPWDPWWKKSSARSITLGPNGNQLIRSLCEEENTECSSNTFEASINEVPSGPEGPLPPLHQLSRTNASPLLAVHVIDVIYSYCFTLRFYNGDWHSDPLGASMVALTISSILGRDSRPETVTEALASCLEQTCSPAFRHAGGIQFGLLLIDDVVCLLSLGANAIICLLCDLHRLIQAGQAALKSEKMGKEKRSGGDRKLKGLNRKIYFLMCWAHEQPEEAWSSLTGIIDVEKASFSALHQSSRKHSKGTGKGTFKAKVLVEEV